MPQLGIVQEEQANDADDDQKSLKNESDQDDQDADEEQPDYERYKFDYLGRAGLPDMTDIHEKSLS